MKISVEVLNCPDDLDMRCLKAHHLATLLLILQTASLWHVFYFLSSTGCEFPKYQAFTRYSHRAMLSVNYYHTAYALGGRIYHWLVQHRSLTPLPVLLTGFWRYFPNNAVKKHCKNKLVKNCSSTLSPFINCDYFTQFMNK